MKEAKIVEVVLFNLNTGVSREQFLEDAIITQMKVEKYRGYIDRQLLEDESGQWIDIVWWESFEDAHAAADLIMQDEACTPFMQAINTDTLKMMHLSPIALKSLT